MTLVGVERLDWRGHGDRADDGELGGRTARVGDADRHAVGAAGFAGCDLRALVVRARPLVGGDPLGEARPAPDADRLRDAVRRHDLVGVRVDDHQRHLHRVEQVLLLSERPRGALRLSLRLAPVHLESRQQHDQDRAEQRDGAARERRRGAREERQQPRALRYVKRRHGADVADDGMRDGRDFGRPRAVLPDDSRERTAQRLGPARRESPQQRLPRGGESCPRLRPRLRRVLPQPPLRGRPPPRGLHGRLRCTDAPSVAAGGSPPSPQRSSSSAAFCPGGRSAVAAGCRRPPRTRSRGVESS